MSLFQPAPVWAPRLESGRYRNKSINLTSIITLAPSGIGIQVPCFSEIHPVGCLINTRRAQYLEQIVSSGCLLAKA